LCSHTFKDSESIGSLLEQQFNSEAISEYIKWYSTNPFEDPKCIACKLLPLCEGGCRKARVMGQANCIQEKENMGLFVKNLAEQLYQQRS
jgi:radical SAM protein with 4Fe4S-binding SPASM domain